MADKIAYDMFKNYYEDDGSIPDNRFGPGICIDPPSIVYGATNTLTFCVPGVELNDIAAVTMLTRSGLTTTTVPLIVYDEDTNAASILEEVEGQLVLTETPVSVAIEYTMSAEESLAADPKYDFSAQCQVVLVNGDTVMTTKINYKVIYTLLADQQTEDTDSSGDAASTSLI